MPPKMSYNPINNEQDDANAIGRREERMLTFTKLHALMNHGAKLVWRAARVWSRLWQKPHISDVMTHRFKGLGLGLGPAFVGDVQKMIGR